MPRYKLRIYDGQYEVLAKLELFADVDLDLPVAEVLLMQRLQSLTALAVAHNEPMDHPRLQVCDVASGKAVMELVA